MLACSDHGHGDTNYPVGSCGANMWGEETGGNSKCVGSQPYPQNAPSLYAIFADSAEECCMWSGEYVQPPQHTPLPRP